MATNADPITAAADEDLPTRFAQLEKDAEKGECRFCGKPATHRLQLVARLASNGGGAGLTKQAAAHKQDYCETHAVALFVKVKKAMR